jgi:hypothetical protein
VEFDVVALSPDGKTLLVGECKWAEKRAVVDVARLTARLRERASAIPAARGRRIVTACWLGGGAKARELADNLHQPEEVMTALER